MSIHAVGAAGSFRPHLHPGALLVVHRLEHLPSWLGAGRRADETRPAWRCEVWVLGAEGEVLAEHRQTVIAATGLVRAIGRSKGPWLTGRLTMGRDAWQLNAPREGDLPVASAWMDAHLGAAGTRAQQVAAQVQPVIDRRGDTQ